MMRRFRKNCGVCLAALTLCACGRAVTSGAPATDTPQGGALEVIRSFDFLGTDNKPFLREHSGSEPMNGVGFADLTGDGQPEMLLSWMGTHWGPTACEVFSLREGAFVSLGGFFSGAYHGNFLSGDEIPIWQTPEGDEVLVQNFALSAGGISYDIYNEVRLDDFINRPVVVCEAPYMESGAEISMKSWQYAGGGWPGGNPDIATLRDGATEDTWKNGLYAIDQYQGNLIFLRNEPLVQADIVYSLQNAYRPGTTAHYNAKPLEKAETQAIIAEAAAAAWERWYSVSGEDREWHPPMAEREYLRFSVQDAPWSEKESDFPAAWLEDARELVLTAKGATECRLARGWMCDFDRDGRQEALLLMYGPKGGMDWLDGDKHFVYAEDDGRLQLLASGVDDRALDGSQQIRMDAALLHYPEFNHLILKSGNHTAASSSCNQLYSFQKDGLQLELEEKWLKIKDGVCLRGYGQMGIRTGPIAWDTKRRMYGSSGGVRILPEAFCSLFDAERFTCDEWQQGRLEDFGLDPRTFSQEDIIRVSTCAGRYFSIQTRNHPTGDAWLVLERLPSGAWRAVEIDTPMSEVELDERTGFDVLYDIAFTDAGHVRAVPDDLLQRPELIGRITGSPVDYQRVCTGNLTCELIVTDAEARVFVTRQDESGRSLLQCLDAPGLTAPSEAGPDGLVLKDVDFDGYPDLLVRQGSSGTLPVTNACFLWRDGVFEEAESFSEIKNPYVDTRKKAVYGSGAGTSRRGWGRYEFIDGAFVETSGGAADQTEDSRIYREFLMELLGELYFPMEDSLALVDYGRIVGGDGAEFWAFGLAPGIQDGIYSGMRFAVALDFSAVYQVYPYLSDEYDRIWPPINREWGLLE